MYKQFKNTIFLVLFSHVSLSASDEMTNSLKPFYSFINTSINYLDWNKHTEQKTIQKDFVYLELEGGAGWSWGEFYGLNLS